jgi:predicted transcriptional regulator
MERKAALLYAIIGFIFVLIFALCFAIGLYIDVKADRDRLKKNQSLLLHNGMVEITETGTGKSRASTPALTLHSDEFRQSSDTLAQIARQAGIKPKRISEAATAATRMTADITATVSHHAVTGVTGTQVDTVRNWQVEVLPSHDVSTCLPVTPPADFTPLRGGTGGETLSFIWHDPWLSLSGSISDSLFHGTVSATDTLDIVVHRVPKRFLFFRFGCREVRMDIISRNPHTRLTYARYYKLVK